MASKLLEFIIELKDSASKELKNFNNELKKTGTFDKVGESAARGIRNVGIAAAGAFAVGIREAAQFEQAMSNVSTLLSGDVNSSIRQLETGIRSMSSELPKSPEELGAAAYDIVSAGINETADALAVLESSGRLAVAGLGTTAEAANLTTSAINAFQIDASQADAVANVLFKTVKAGKTTVQELNQGFGQLAPAAVNAGVAFEQAQAATAALTTTGLKASVAQTQLRQLFVELNKEGTKLSSAFEEVGITNVKAAVQSGDFVGVLNQLKTEAGLTDVEFQNLFSSVESGSAALSLTSAVGEAYKESLTEMTNGTDLLTGAVERQSETFNNQGVIAVNNLKRAFDLFAQEALPGATGALGIFNEQLGQVLDRKERVIQKTQDEKEIISQLEVMYDNYGKGMSEAAFVQGEFIEKLIKGQELMIDQTKAWEKGDTEAVAKIMEKRKELADETVEFAKQNSEFINATSMDWSKLTGVIDQQSDEQSGHINLLVQEMINGQEDARESLEETKEAFFDQASAIKQASEQGASDVEIATSAIALAYRTATGQVTEEVDNMVGDVSQKVQEPAASASTWGGHLVDNFIAGIKSKYGALGVAVAGIVEIAKDIKFSKNKLMPTEIWGAHFMENFIGGIEEGFPKLQETMDALVQKAVNTGKKIESAYNDIGPIDLDLDFEVPRDLEDFRKLMQIEELDIPTGDAFRDLTDEQKDAYREMERESEKNLKALQDNLEGSIDSYDDLREAAVESLQDMEKQTMESIGKMDDQLNKLDNELSNLQSTFASELKGSSQSVAEQVVRQEDLIKSLKDEYSSLAESVKETQARINAETAEGGDTSSLSKTLDEQKTKLQETKNEIERQSGALNSFFENANAQLESQQNKVAELQKQLASGGDEGGSIERKLKIEQEVLQALQDSAISTEEEIAAAKERARLTDFERFIADAEAKKMRLIRDFAEKKVLLEEEIVAVNAQRDAEIQAFEDKIQQYEKTGAAFQDFKTVFEVGLNDMANSAESRVARITSAISALRASLSFLDSEAGTELLSEVGRLRNLDIGPSPVPSPRSQGSQPSNITIQVNNPNISGAGGVEDFASRLAEQIELQTKGSQ